MSTNSEPSRRKPSAQRALVLMVLTIGELAVATSCTLQPSPLLPPVPYSEIRRVRQEFLGGRTVGLSYYPSAWDGMLEGKGPIGRRAFGPNPRTGKYELALYVRLKNLGNLPFRVVPTYFVLITVKGVTYSAGAATASTSQPFPTTELHPQASTEGYIVFELPWDVFVRDQPSLLEYNDGVGNHAVRHLLVPDMVQYEGLAPAVSEESKLSPVPQAEMQQGRRWIPGHWENRWVPGHWYGEIWYRGRYETFWIEGRWE